MHDHVGGEEEGTARTAGAGICQLGDARAKGLARLRNGERETANRRLPGCGLRSTFVPRTLAILLALRPPLPHTGNDGELCPPDANRAFAFPAQLLRCRSSRVRPRPAPSPLFEIPGVSHFALALCESLWIAVRGVLVSLPFCRASVQLLCLSHMRFEALTSTLFATHTQCAFATTLFVTHAQFAMFFS